MWSGVTILIYVNKKQEVIVLRGRPGRDHMVVGYITTYMQSLPIITKVVSSIPTQASGPRYNM